MTTLDEALATPGAVEQPFNCPSHDDSNASASVNTALGVWVCYACGASGKASGGTATGAAKRYLEHMDGRREPRVLPHAWLELFDDGGVQPSPYWSDRYSVPVAQLHRCGTDPFTGLPTYPVWSPDGQVWGVVTRTDGDPKYVYPPDVPISRTLYRIHEAPNRVDVLVVCEGAADVMAFDLWFHGGNPHGLTVAAVGVYGCGLHATQVDMIAARTPRRVLVAFDDDPAGRRGAEDAVHALHGRGLHATALDWSDTPGAEWGKPDTDLGDLASSDPYGEWMLTRMEKFI